MAPTTRFRPAIAADLDAIVALMQGYYAEEGYPFHEGDARRALVGLVEDERLGRLWVAELDGRLGGYLAITFGYSLEYGGRDAFIDELFIAQDGRGAGLGREAVALAEAHCRQVGVRAVHLEVELHRDAAQHLYRDAGFESHKRTLMTKWLVDP